MLALASLVLSVSWDKYRNLCATKGRKSNKKLEQQQQQQQPNSAAILTDRDRLGFVQSAVSQLQICLVRVNECIGKFSTHTQTHPKNSTAELTNPTPSTKQTTGRRRQPAPTIWSIVWPSFR